MCVRLLFLCGSLVGKGGEKERTGKIRGRGKTRGGVRYGGEHYIGNGMGILHRIYWCGNLDTFYAGIQTSYTVKPLPQETNHMHNNVQLATQTKQIRTNYIALSWLKIRCITPNAMQF
jgi:hypothetical protein